MTDTVTIRRRGSFGRAFTPDLTRCRANVADGGRSFSSHQCEKVAKVFRDVIVYGEEEKGVQSIGFCTIHDPVKVAEKRKAAQERWDREAERHKQAHARNKDRPAEYVEVLREIAAGHNDPRALAAEVLAKWSDEA